MSPILSKNNLKKISLIFSVITIIIIIFISLFSEPKIILIKDISREQLDNYVKLNGTIINVENIKSKDYSFYIIRLKDSSDSIDLVSDKSDLELNQKVEVIGKVSEYKNTLQIEVKKIKDLS